MRQPKKDLPAYFVCSRIGKLALVAQWIERSVAVREVVGSIPTQGTEEISRIFTHLHQDLLRAVFCGMITV